MTRTVQDNRDIVPDLIVIVYPDYAPHLKRTSQIAPVWIVSTEANTEACERLWKINPHADHREKGGITSYNVRDSEDRMRSLLEIIPELETHHGEIQAGEFCFPSGFILEVVGLGLTDHVMGALREFGFTSFINTTDGFQASK